MELILLYLKYPLRMLGAAGVIFTHKMNISGLTTSAGLWATVGVGMALGAGMYVRIRPAAFLCRGI